MKMLFLAAIVSPIALAQSEPAAPSPETAPPVKDEYTSTVRPEKAADFRARSAELDKRATLLEEEKRRLDTVPEKQVGKAGPVVIPTGGLEHLTRVAQYKADLQAFRKELAEETGLKRKQDAAFAKARAERQAKGLPEPSSVPGFPAGVEPTKKQRLGLPVGMTKAK
jgi:hypothetical protein